MRKTIYIILLLSVCARVSQAQETSPPSQYLKSVNAQFFMDSRDSSIWHFKGAATGWERLGRYKDVAAKLNISDTSALLNKTTAAATYVKQQGDNSLIKNQTGAVQTGSFNISGSGVYGNPSSGNYSVTTPAGLSVYGDAAHATITSSQIDLHGANDLKISTDTGVQFNSNSYIQFNGQGLRSSTSPSNPMDVMRLQDMPYYLKLSGISQSITQTPTFAGGIALGKSGQPNSGIYNDAYGASLYSAGTASLNGTHTKAFGTPTQQDDILRYQDSALIATILGDRFLKNTQQYVNYIQNGGTNTKGTFRFYAGSATDINDPLYAKLNVDGIEFASNYYNVKSKLRQDILSFSYGDPAAHTTNFYYAYDVGGGGDGKFHIMRDGGDQVIWSSDLTNYFRTSGINELMPGNFVALKNNNAVFYIDQYNIASIGADFVLKTAGSASTIFNSNTGNGGMPTFYTQLRSLLPPTTSGYDLVNRRSADSLYSSVSGNPNYAASIGSSAYLQNQKTTPQTADFSISGTGSIGTVDIGMGGVNYDSSYGLSFKSGPVEYAYFGQSVNDNLNWLGSNATFIGGTKPSSWYAANGAQLYVTGNTYVTGGVTGSSFKVGATIVNSASITLDANTAIGANGGGLSLNAQNGSYTLTNTTSNKSFIANVGLAGDMFQYLQGAPEYVLLKQSDGRLYKYNSGNPKKYLTEDEAAPITGSNNYITKSGDTMTGDLLLTSATPTNPLSAVPKIMLDNALTGITWKNAVRVKTTGNITLSGTQTIDGIAVVAGNRVLVNSQTDATQNGIYIVASGAWTRAVDADAGDELWTSTVAVTLGTANKNTQWTCLNTMQPIVGTDAITYGQISGAGTYAADGTLLTLTGNLFAVNALGIRNLFSNGTGLAYNATTGQFSTSNIPNASLANSTISGVSLGSSLASLSAGIGIVLPAYNGSTTQSVSVDQTFTPTWTGLHTFKRDNLSNTGVGSVLITNTMSATSSVQQQNSPAFTWSGQYWNGTASQQLQFRSYWQPFAGGGTLSDFFSPDGTTWNYIGGKTSSGTYYGAGMNNTASGNNAAFSLTNSGTIITDNNTNNFAALIVNGITAHTSGDLFAVQNAGSSKFRVDYLGNLITSSTATSGHRFDNTVDQTTNYERAKIYWNSNTFTVATEFGGTGGQRGISLNAVSTLLNIQGSNSGNQGIVEIRRDNTSVTSLLGIGSTSLQASASTQNGISIYPTINQTGSGGYRGLWISPYEQALGTGVRYLIDAGFNSAANASGGHTSVFNVDKNGNITTASSAFNGHSFYNTTDQTTNTERVNFYWSGNSFNINSSATGTGALRDIVLAGGASKMTFSALGAANFSVEVRRDNTSINTLMAVTSSSLLGTSMQNALAIYPTINQSGAGAYRGLWISPYEQANGTGVKYLIDAGLNSAATGSGTHTTKFRVDNLGNGLFTGNLQSAGRIAAITATVLTANYTATATDEIIRTNSTTAGFTVTLLSTAVAGQTYTIENTAGTANVITIAGIVNGATNYTLNAGKYVTLYKTATGANTWNIIGNN